MYWIIVALMALSAIIAGDDYFCDGEVNGDRSGGSYSCNDGSPVR